jgi:hypothetical protein
MGKRISLNQRFGRLLVTKKLPSEGRQSRWETKCDCGNTKIIFGQNLRSGGTTSCGCWVKEWRCKPRPNNVKKNALFNSLKGSYSKDARHRNLDFELTDDEFKRMICGECFYCGEPPSRFIKSKNGYHELTVSGIDRKDNTKGYFYTNCVSCCARCNLGKSNLTEAAFLNWIRKVYLYQIEHSLPLIKINT